MDRFTRVIDDLYVKTKVLRMFPVPVFDIAKGLGYTVSGFEMNPHVENISGVIFYKTKQILLNPTEFTQRRNFTLAHEIAHIVLSHNDDDETSVDMRSSIQNPVKDTKEWDANQFAAELLMPEIEFIKIWNEYKMAYRLSEYFDVSASAVFVRLKSLDIDYANG